VDALLTLKDQYDLSDDTVFGLLWVSILQTLSSILVFFCQRNKESNLFGIKGFVVVVVVQRNKESNMYVVQRSTLKTRHAIF
jgi:hypothetical protein